jgi:threonyl-tRNA synthetase
MLHRALFGSVERFFGVLLEHYAGAFPTWMAPVQVKVLPVADAHADYARTVEAELRGAGLRVEVIASDEQLGKRIRNAKMEKVPYVLVVGDDDARNGTVGVNPRGGDVERDVTTGQFVQRILAEISDGLNGGD